MGLLQKYKNYKQSRLAKRIEKNLKIITNRKAIKEDRAMALDFFKDLPDTNVAVPALLQRFEYSLEHGINDTREKETALAGILSHKEAALPHVIAHLKNTTRIAWPIKILAELMTKEQMGDALKEVLNFADISFDQSGVDKNFDILCYLADYKLPGFVGKLSHFLKDPDERVRYASVEVLLNQDEDEVRILVEPFLADESAENRRIRVAVADAFVKKEWRVEDPKKFPSGLVMEGIFLTKKGKLERR